MLIFGIQTQNGWILLSTFLPTDTFLTLLYAWVFYKNPIHNNTLTSYPLVSVIIPVFNQKNMIETVLDAVASSSYPNLELIIVDDGSTDATRSILRCSDKLPPLKTTYKGDKIETIQGIYEKLGTYIPFKVIFKTNGGKRRAVARGFDASRGKYVVLLDSDSIIGKTAIMEFVKVFESDNKVGIMVGNVKAWNNNKNSLTRMQDVWYDFSFNLGKASESIFGAVTCCSGCLAAARRQAIAKVITIWSENPVQYSDDRDLTSDLIGVSKLFRYASKFNDGEDRVTTAHALLKWKSVFVKTAIGFTDVPETLRSFINQQIRWKRGYIRTNFFVNSFFYKKHPMIAIKYYIEFGAVFLCPLISFALLFYIPIIQGAWMASLGVIGLSALVGISQGLDYKFRNPRTKNWFYKPLMDLLSFHVLSWYLFPVLLTLNKDKWLTR
jgi:hyaluronan synthase